MAWRNSVNGVLRQLTGHELRRAKVPVSRAASAAAPATQPAPKPAPSPAPARDIRFPDDYDDEARETIRAVKPFTMTSPEKLFALIQAIRYVVKHDIPGDIVECGVWRGGSMQACAKTLLQLGVTDRELLLFDTFEGMTPPTEEDVRATDGRPAEKILAAVGKDRPIWAVASLEDVKAGFENIPYPEERIHYFPGPVEETIPERSLEQISILRLDTDWYSSTKHELDYLYPLLSSGGALLLDDYGHWQGARQAVDEFVEKSQERLLLLRMDEGRIAVKP